MVTLNIRHAYPNKLSIRQYIKVVLPTRWSILVTIVAPQWGQRIDTGSCLRIIGCGREITGC